MTTTTNKTVLVAGDRARDQAHQVGVDVTALERELARLKKAVERTSEARRKLPPGSSRARVTSANAKWARACEAYDRALRAAEEQ